MHAWPMQGSCKVLQCQEFSRPVLLNITPVSFYLFAILNSSHISQPITFFICEINQSLSLVTISRSKNAAVKKSTRKSSDFTIHSCNLQARRCNVCQLYFYIYQLNHRCKAMQGLLKIWTGHSHWFFLNPKSFEIAQQKLQHFYN